MTSSVVKGISRRRGSRAGKVKEIKDFSSAPFFKQYRDYKPRFRSIKQNQT